MTHTAHTPGPWSAICEDRKSAKQGIDKAILFWSISGNSPAYSGSVCTVHSAEHIGGTTISERDANARLIAAAPDLYEALYRLSNECKIDGLQERAGFDCWLAMADKALAAARGEPS